MLSRLTRRYRGRVLLRHGNRDSHVVGGAIGVGHNNRNLDLATGGSVPRNINRDLTSVLINGHTIRRPITRSERGICRRRGALTILVLKRRSRNRYLVTRLTRTIGVLRLEVIIRVRNLRIRVLTVRDAVIIVILILGIRLAITISIQLKVSLHLISAAILIRHLNRNIKRFRRVLIQLRLIRERNSDLTSRRIKVVNITLRSSEAITNSKLRILRNIYTLTSRISKRRSRRRPLVTRNNQLTLIRRLELLVVLRRRLIRLLNREWGISMGNNAALGLRLAVVTLYRIAVLVENRDLQVLVAHHNWELERLTNLVSVRSKGHDASHRINRNLILSDALRQCAKPETCLFRLGFCGVGSRVVKLRLGGSSLSSLRLDLVVLKVFASYSEGIQSQNQIVIWIWIAVSKLQASSERITSLGILRDIERTAWDLGRGISFSGLTGLDDFAGLVYPLDVVGQILSDRQTGGISLNRIADRCPVISGVLIHYIELQGLRRKRDVPTRVAISGVTN